MESDFHKSQTHSLVELNDFCTHSKCKINSLHAILFEVSEFNYFNRNNCLEALAIPSIQFLLAEASNFVLTNDSNEEWIRNKNYIFMRKIKATTMKRGNFNFISLFSSISNENHEN